MTESRPDIVPFAVENQNHCITCINLSRPWLFSIDGEKPTTRLISPSASPYRHLVFVEVLTAVCTPSASKAAAFQPGRNPDIQETVSQPCPDSPRQGSKLFLTN